MIDHHLTIMNTKGLTMPTLKNHCAVTFKGSMVVCGGQSENGVLSTDTYVFNFDNAEWIKLAID